MRFEFGTITAQHRDVIVIAGGPSLADFDFGQLPPSATVIAVNETAARVPQVDYCFTIDSAILRTRMPFYHGQPVAAVPDDYLQPTARKRGWQSPPVRPIPVIYLRRVMADRLSDDRSVINHCSNSGYGALNLAYHMRPKRVGLLGFDHRDLEKYWYGKGRVCPRPWEHDLKPYRNALRQFAGIGCRVVNGSPESALNMFERWEPEEVCKWLS